MTGRAGKTPTSNLPPPNVAVSVIPKGLQPGHYTSDIQIAARNSRITSSPQIVHISFTVTALPKPPNPGPKSNVRDREEYVYIPPGRFKMGCVPGEIIRVEQVAPLGDPISISVAGYNLSLRINEAQKIFVEEII